MPEEVNLRNFDGYEKIYVNKNNTIRDTLKTIDIGAVKFALVVAGGNKLDGVITDGDIRRALLNGKTLEDSIENVYTDAPIVCKKTDGKAHIETTARQYGLNYMPLVSESGEIESVLNVTFLEANDAKTNKVVLMLGGLGTRLRPLTNDTPKPMLKVGDKPIIHTIIDSFIQHGFTSFILSVSYRSEIIIEYFGDGSKFGANIEYAFENKRMGTAGALGLITEKLTEPFFVMNGDLLTNLSFSNMMDAHVDTGSVATMGVREYDYQVPFGVVEVENDIITAIEEKPVKQFYVNGGVYVLNPEMLELIPFDIFYDMPTLFEAAIDKKLETAPYPIRGYWLDIGRIEDYEKANKEYSVVFG